MFSQVDNDGDIDVLNNGKLYLNDGNGMRPDYSYDQSGIPSGFWCGEGATRPETCKVGFYANAPGRTDDSCSGPCDVGYTCVAGADGPTYTGGVSACEVGFYLKRGGGIASSCARCAGDTAGFTCEEEGVTVEKAPVRSGYWRQYNTSYGEWVVECFNKPACIGALQPATAAAANASRRQLEAAILVQTYGDVL